MYKSIHENYACITFGYETCLVIYSLNGTCNGDDVMYTKMHGKRSTGIWSDDEHKDMKLRRQERERPTLTSPLTSVRQCSIVS